MDFRKTAQEKRIALDDEPEATKVRASWVASRPDEGDLYRRKLTLLTDESTVQEAKGVLSRALEDLRATVAVVLETRGIDNHDVLLDTITSYKQLCNRNKKLKNVWMKAVEQFEHVQRSVGLDFNHYYDVLTGKKGARTKAPPANLHLDIAASLKRVTEADRALNDLLDRIYRLILANFDLGQEGRYFKKWHALSPEEKAARRHSYSVSFASQHPDVVPEEMTRWLMSSLENKGLRTTDVQWNTKKGIVEGIKRLKYAAGSGFSLDDLVRAPRAPKKGGDHSTVERTHTCYDELRVNRLLATHLFSSGQKHEPATLCDSVMKKYARYASPPLKKALKERIASQYAAMVKIIREHPMHSS
ncbi:hypothetical protein HDU86_006082 [Geranomyces michiganensis]|nr:hypothetical protein HDU86_006082 [Geranomyces michiganensis]